MPLSLPVTLLALALVAGAAAAQQASFGECAPKAVLEEVRQGKPGTPTAAHTASRYVFYGCRDGTEIALWKLSGAGHVWPGGRIDYLPRLLGPGTDVIDANEEMWKFFRRFALPPART